MPNLPTGRVLVEFYPDANCAALIKPSGQRILCMSKESLWDALASLALGKPVAEVAPDRWPTIAKALSGPVPSPLAAAAMAPAHNPAPVIAKRYTPKGREILDLSDLELDL